MLSPATHAWKNGLKQIKLVLFTEKKYQNIERYITNIKSFINKKIHSLKLFYSAMI